MNIPPPPPVKAADTQSVMHSQQAQKWLRELLALNPSERREMHDLVGKQNDYLEATGQLI